MRTLPPEPNPGEKIRASLIRELIRAIRERTPIAGQGMSVSIGPNGAVISSKEGKSNRSSLPWSFSCSEDENGERTGGWTNCLLQLGYDMVLHSEDITHVRGRGHPNTVISGTDTCDDGRYYVEVDLKNETAEIVVNPASTRHDLENDIVRIYIGKVQDGLLVEGIHYNPVVYKYV